eukprot:bmy_05584T0
MKLSFWLAIEHLKIFHFFLGHNRTDTPPESLGHPGWEFLLHTFGTGLVTGCLLSEPGSHRDSTFCP